MGKKRLSLGIVAIFSVLLLSAGIYFWQQSARKSGKRSLDFPSRPNILLITIDTTRADHLPVYGYKGVRTPHLDSIAKNGILFRQCASSSPLTLPAHSSMLTGMYPTYHGVRINGNTALSTEHQTMAEALAQNGYATGAFVGAFVLDGRWGLNQGFQHYDDQFDLKKFKKLDLGLVQRPANEVVDAAIQWLEGQKNKSFFAWLHLYDPHTPYAPPEPYRSQYGSTGMAGLYDGEIAFMDEQIGRTLAWLESNNLKDQTLVAVIGDHGEGLGDHGEMTHGYFIYDYAVHVPFILSTPDKELNGLEISAQVRSIDLYPTLLEATGTPYPKNVQGVSLWGLIQSGGSHEKILYAYSESMAPSMQYGWSPLLSLRSATYKYIDAPRPELFDLKKDPEEQNDLLKKQAEIADEYDRILKQVVIETSAGAPAPNAANLDSETMERLAALGYVGSAVSTRREAGSNALVDPKDRLQVHEAIQKAGELSNNDQHREAAGVLEQVLREDPLNPQARLLLAGSYVETESTDKASAILRALLEEDAKNIRALISLANILQEEGKPHEVITMCKSVIEVDDRNTQALAMLGESYMNVRNFNAALPWLEKAVDVQPKLTQNQLNLAACQVGLKRYPEAESTLKKILQEHPKFPLAHFHLGLLYEEQGQFREAAGAYSEEIKLYENSFVARFNLGRLHLRLGDHPRYMEEMRQVVQIAPKNPAGYLFLARGLLQENADTNEILDLTEQGLSLAQTPEYKAMGYFMLADVYTRRKEPQKVRAALAKANQYKQQIEKGKI